MPYALGEPCFAAMGGSAGERWAIQDPKWSPLQRTSTLVMETGRQKVREVLRKKKRAKFQDRLEVEGIGEGRCGD